jgi:GTP-binding protein HflX
LEIGRRRARERITRLEKQLTNLRRKRGERRRQRQQGDVPVVAILGYTNAGKSTLLNTLTRASVLAENRLFATLDTRARRLHLPSGREAVMTDTVGFIRRMPKELFAAFRATFEEAADADLLLEVVDVSDEEHGEHMVETERLLSELCLDRIPKLRVYNKIDRLTPDQLATLAPGNDGVLCSAANKDTTRALLERLEETLPDGRGRASRRAKLLDDPPRA